MLVPRTAQDSRPASAAKSGVRKFLRQRSPRPQIIGLVRSVHGTYDRHLSGLKWCLSPTPSKHPRLANLFNHARDQVGCSHGELTVRTPHLLANAVLPAGCHIYHAFRGRVADGLPSIISKTPAGTKHPALDGGS
jgi:hypothetical protein